MDDGGQIEFQSPRGDFGFLKDGDDLGVAGPARRTVSIPSRGFWFFEAKVKVTTLTVAKGDDVSIPSRGFWFFEGLSTRIGRLRREGGFQSPRGDFGFLK